MRKIALVIVDNDVLALKGIYALKNLGYKICILANNKSSTLAHSRYVSSFEMLPPAVSDEILLDIIREFGADIIFPAEIDSAGRLYRLSRLDSGLPIFPCSSGNLLDALDNKDRFISLISDYRINHPKSILLSPPFLDIDSLLGTIDFPLVAKNLYGESGRGVSLLKSRIEFDLYIQGQIAGGLKSPMQLQKFIPGDVFGLNICAVNGVICAWSVYKKLDGDTLQFLDRFDICELLSGLVKDTKFSGLANFDLIVGKDGIYLLECNPRVWYTIQADRFLGLDFVEVGIANRLSPVEAAKVGRITGTYTFPKKTLKMLINPMTIFRVNYPSLSGVIEVVSDPLSQLRKIYKESRKAQALPLARHRQ